MRILGILVENIRSYKKSAIILPPSGITVIYGSSGSGKTSLLMSINFALFGMATGSRSGDLFDAYKTPHGTDLLRVDSVRGRVRLLVALGNRLYAIERGLEKQGTKYSSGTGVVEEYAIGDQGILRLVKRKVFESRTEMDNYVTDLLGVREKRSERGVATPLVYTTALYVPQFKTHEVMELDDSKRVEIIERALGLEKYKLFRLSYEKVLKVLKDKLREFEVRIGEYSKRLKEKSKEKLLKEKEQLLVEYSKVEREKTATEEEYNKLREQEKILQDRLRDLELKKQELFRQLEEYKRVSDKLVEVEKKITELLRAGKFDEELINKFVKTLQVKLEELNQERSALESEISNTDMKIIVVEEELRKLREKLVMLEKKASEYEKEIELGNSALAEMEKEYKEIEELVRKGVCPTCRQPISHEHGLKLIAEKSVKLSAEKTRLEKLRRELEEIAGEVKKLKQAEKILEEEKTAICTKRSSAAKRRDEVLGEIKKISELLARLSELLALRSDLVNELAKINVKGVESELKHVEERVTNTRSEIEKMGQLVKSVLEKREKLSRELGKIEESLRVIERDLKEIERLSEELAKFQKKVNTLGSIAELLEHSSQAVEEVEKNVLKVLVNEFRHHFYEYISALIPDQPVEVTVKDDFNLSQKIKIGRSVYSVTSLSGGQSTAISLAYRLALNQTVRRYSPTLRKSVLILDEPTTGFSRELVNRLRDLLKSMSGIEGQVIVVTHDETLIEAGDCKIRLSLDHVEHRTIVEYEECELEKNYRELVESILTGSYSARQVEITKPTSGFEPKVAPIDKNAKISIDEDSKKRSILDYLTSSPP